MTVQTAIEKEVLQNAIDSYLNEHLLDYLSRFQGLNEARLKELSIVERVVRVEEELRHLREIEMVRHESLMKEMNTRFEALQKEMNTRFEALQKEMNARFEAMNARFEAMNARFDSLEKRMSFIQWLIGTAIALTALFATFAPFLYRKFIF